MRTMIKTILTTTAFAVTFGVTVASLGSSVAHAGSRVDNSEVGGMSCHQAPQNATRCQGWGR